MPDRIVRDELLRSHRYRTLSSDTSRLLFMHLLLSVDSFGNAEANNTAISDAVHRPLDDATVAKLLGELSDADLIRLYQIDEKAYLHIPRFRQRLRYLNTKHPRPPESVECKEINRMLEKVRPKSGEVLPKSVEVKRSEVKRSEAKHLPRPPVDNSTAPTIKTVLNKLAVKGEKPNGLSRDEQLAFVAKNGKA